MDDAQLLRYSRHILLDEIGIEGQQRLLASRALVIGAGGLGSPVALYLGSAGVGRITLVDHDRVDLTNLQRQIAHTPGARRHRKGRSRRARRSRAINPEVQVTARARATPMPTCARRLGAPMPTWCSTAATTSRRGRRCNAACVRHRVPLVSGAAIRFDGQISVYDTRDAACPCYACVFPPDAAFR